MRAVETWLAIALLVTCVTPLLADPSSPPEEKPWSITLDGTRTTYPEVEPNDACPGQVMGIMDVIDPARIDAPGDNDWYQFTVAWAPLTITLGTDASPGCDPDAGDTYIYLIGPDCTTQLAADDDSGPGLYSMIDGYVVNAPGTYHIRVRHYSAAGTGCYRLFLTMPLAPPHDLCAYAVELARCGNHVIQDNLSHATNNYNPAVPGPSCTGFSAAGKDLVYRMSLEAGDQVHLVYTTPDYDGSIYVVTDCDHVSASCVVGEDDPEPETIDWTVAADGVYFIIADAYGLNAGGAFTLEIGVSCPPTPVDRTSWGGIKSRYH